MKITDVEAIIVKQESISLIGDGSQDTVVIRVRTDEGLSGIGEVDSSPYVVKAIVEAPASHMVCMGLREVLKGEDPMHVERLWEKMYRLSYYYGRRGAAIHAISGVDLALWDLKGKALGKPVSELLGGAKRTEVAAYCSVLMPETEAEIAALVERHAPRGFTGFKFGWGALGRDKDLDERLVGWARKHVGPKLALAIDIGMVWPNAGHALEMAARFEKFGLAWLEEPLSPDDLEGYAKVCAGSKIPISAGEELGPLQEFQELLKAGISVVQPDLSRCGGLTVARQIAALAQAHGKIVVPHAFKTGILLGASLQFVASLPQARFMEYCAQETPLSRMLMKDHFQPDSKGMLAIPAKPGLGVEVDEEVLEKFRLRN